jgi:hypothetical protein
MARVRRIVGRAVILVSLLVAGLLLYATMRARSQDLPWTELDLGETPGLFTGRKLAALTGDAGGCRALLEKAGVAFTALERRGAGECAFADGVRFRTGGSRSVRYAPADLDTACPVAAALAMWEWNVVQPAARRHLSARVERIEHLGSYNCRRLYGRGTGAWSEHATADAVDIAGFVLEDGRRLTVLGDWRDEGAKARFLREVRDGACGLFSTVLSPDYNAAHRDHLHLDQAERGATGWRACG